MLRFKYKCNNCGKEIKMSERDIANFILNCDFYGYDIDEIIQFFKRPNYNLCRECAKKEELEVFNLMNFEGYEESEEE